MAAGELQACIIPVAAIEQHLEHLAMEHDWRSVRHLAVQVAERLRPHALVAEGLMAGISEHHMKHPGTLTLSSSTFLAVVEDLIDSVVRAGFRHVLVLNGHGGNMPACGAAWDQLLRRFQINLQFLSYWDVLMERDGEDLLEGGSKMLKDLPGHAQEFETTFALALFPEKDRHDACEDQAETRPTLATAEKGQAFIERIVNRLTSFVRDMIDGERVIDVPPFFP